MSAAWYNSELSSKRGVKGIVKKVSYLALVVTTMILNWMISQGLQQIAEGGNGGQLICYNCYAINNTRSNFSSNVSGFTTVNYGNKMICINCISDCNEVGYNAGVGTHMTLINCTSINDISPKANSDNMTIKNGTIVS